MKYYITFIAIFCAWFTTQAQVGIGVETPTEMLEVDKGDVYVADQFYMSSIKTYNGGEDGFHIIAADPQSSSLGNELLNGQIIEFTENQEILPILIQPYQIKNIRYHKMDNLNLNIPTNKYEISLSNFEAIPGSGNLGLYRVANSGGTNPDITYSNFVIRTFEGPDNNWHVQIIAPNVPDNSTNSSWTYDYNFDIVIFPKRFFRDLGEYQYNLNGSSQGSAGTPPNGL